MTEQRKADIVARLRASGATLDCLEDEVRTLAAHRDRLRAEGAEAAADLMDGAARTTYGLYKLMAADA